MLFILHMNYTWLFYSGVLCIHHQSPLRMTLTEGRVEILYCVASGHSFEYRYQWDNVLGPVGVNSPVLYAFEPGTYWCTVTNQVDTVTSEPIVVTEGMNSNKELWSNLFVVNWYRKLEHWSHWRSAVVSSGIWFPRYWTTSMHSSVLSTEVQLYCIEHSDTSADLGSTRFVKLLCNICRGCILKHPQQH